MALTRYHLWKMLGALAVASFLVSTSGLALSPFLRIIATDLQTTLAAVANLLSFTAIFWGIASLLAGAASDRFGRRPILMAAVLAMGCSLLGLSSSQNYLAAALWMIAIGVSGGSFTGTVYAAVSDQVASQQRGRALGWIMTGQSLSMVFGVPLLALLGSTGGWRGALLIYSIVTAVMALVVWLALPADAIKSAPNLLPNSLLKNEEKTTPTPLQALIRPDIVALLCAGTMERICFAIVAVYIPTYLQMSYGVSLSQLALGLSLVAIGTVSGNMVGGFIADRVVARTLLYACSALITALIALPLLLWQPGLTLSLILGFTYSFTNSLGRPSLLASLSEVPNEVRGTVMGMNVTTASVGWLTAAALGGWLVTRVGFHALGLLCTFAGIVGCCLGVTHWHLRRRFA